MPPADWANRRRSGRNSRQPTLRCDAESRGPCDSIATCGSGGGGRLQRGVAQDKPDGGARPRRALDFQPPVEQRHDSMREVKAETAAFMAAVEPARHLRKGAD